MYLITTAEERFWPDKSEKVLFLGEWCKGHDREDEWSKFDSITAKPYAIERQEKKRVNDYADELFKILMCDIADELNEFHSASHSKRYWSILVGTWLRKYTQVIVNRYNTIELALNNYHVTKAISVESIDSGLSFQTYKDFMIDIRQNDLWNHKVYANILQHWPELDLDIIQIKVKSRKKNKDRGYGLIWSEKSKRLVLLLSKFLHFLKKKNDAVIINSYLPILQEVRLQLSLKQVPQLWRAPEVIPVDEDTKARAQFFQNYTKYQGVEREVRRMIHILIPVCYLEGYKSLVNQATNLPWPSSPKFVFTSNNFSSDEVFKLWVADKVESKIPYYIGQHGNNYGTLRSSCTSPAITTCDKFFSWGWSGVYPNQITVPAFIFKTIGQGHVDVNKQGGLIFIGASSLMAAGRLCQDQFYEHMLYQQQVLSFLDNLNVLIRSKTTMRLHSSYRNNKVLNEKLWADSHPDITMDYGYINIFKVIPKNRLTVYSYDSTGILENLSLNLPTVCFWYEGLDDLLLDAIPYYELLIDAKIVHLSPESAAEHIRKYWNNIDEWWGSESVQSVRSIFCKKYARKVDDPVHSLKELLLQD